MGRPSLPTMILRGCRLSRTDGGVGTLLVFYCCAVPLTTSAKEVFSPVESSMLAEKVQWSWSSFETAGAEPCRRIEPGSGARDAGYQSPSH